MCLRSRHMMMTPSIPDVLSTVGRTIVSELSHRGHLMPISSLVLTYRWMESHSPCFQVKSLTMAPALVLPSILTFNNGMAPRVFAEFFSTPPKSQTQSQDLWSRLRFRSSRLCVSRAFFRGNRQLGCGCTRCRGRVLAHAPDASEKPPFLRSCL